MVSAVYFCKLILNNMSGKECFRRFETCFSGYFTLIRYNEYQYSCMSHELQKVCINMKVLDRMSIIEVVLDDFCESKI